MPCNCCADMHRPATLHPASTHRGVHQPELSHAVAPPSAHNKICACRPGLKCRQAPCTAKATSAGPCPVQSAVLQYPFPLQPKQVQDPRSKIMICEICGDLRVTPPPSLTLPHPYPHTAIFISILACGAYPSSLKSSNTKLSMSVLSGLMLSVGKWRGTLRSCCLSGSTWLAYTCVSPIMCTNSPRCSPHTCAIMHVSSE
mmetsp:Transcript_32298/g.82043  ORF Transcript_32298/g.82043 Transcript_32298/m.82043 type:complete len:200 (-) Transcript_32298:430-1029(-)